MSVADSAGTSIAINSYDEWGNPGPGNVGRFAYTGQIVLPELGLYHYKARVYSPRLGRFLQTDPVGYDDQINLYAYVANDPVNKTDPTGMCTSVWNCLTGGTFKQADGSVSVESSVILRTLVPGQVAWDNARTSWANGDKVGAATQTVAAVAEIGLTVATAGISAEAGAVSRATMPTAAPSRVLTAQEAGADLARQSGINRVSAMTPSGRMSIDMAGKSHFEKSVGQEIATPHVKFQPLNTAPNGRTNLGPGTTRAGTMDDIRTARKILERRHQ